MPRRDRVVDLRTHLAEGRGERRLGTRLEERVVEGTALGVLGDVEGALEGDGQRLVLGALTEAIDRGHARFEVANGASIPCGERRVGHIAAHRLGVVRPQTRAEELLERGEDGVAVSQLDLEAVVGRGGPPLQVDVDLAMERDADDAERSAP